MRIGKSRGSYMPVLSRFVAETTGPILELGVGFCSTPYLHWVCYPTRRRLVSYENNPEYYRFCESWKDEFHDVHCIADWDSVNLSEPWSIAFVDHAPPGRRPEEMKKLTHAEYVIVHDTENNNEHRYHLRTIRHLYKYRFKYTKAYPYTTVYTNKGDLSKDDRFKDLFVNDNRQSNTEQVYA